MFDLIVKAGDKVRVLRDIEGVKGQIGEVKAVYTGACSQLVRVDIDLYGQPFDLYLGAEEYEHLSNAIIKHVFIWDGFRVGDGFSGVEEACKQWIKQHGLRITQDTESYFVVE